MAKAAAKSADPAAVEVRVLVACALGSANDVVQVPADEVEGHVAAGLVDTDKAAVAYALSLRAQD